MERFDITIKQGKQEYVFEVKDYVHHDDGKCKFEVYQQDKLVVSFEPHPHEALSVCSNPGKLDKALVNLIADKLEMYQI